MMKTTYLGLVALGLASAASAQVPEAPARPWVLKGTLSASQTADGDDAVLGAGSLSLERSFSNGWAGVSIGAAGGEAAPPPLLTLTVVDQSSLQTAAWVGGTFGTYDLTFSVGYGRQSLDGEATVASGSAPAILAGRSFGFDAEVKAANIAVSVSRSFGEAWTLTPALGVSYDRSESEQSARLRTPSAAPIRIENTAEGYTGSLGATVSGPLNDWLTASFGAVGYTTDNGAAQSFQFGRFDNARALQPEPEGSAQWVELSAGLSWPIGDRVSLSGTAGTTVGRDSDTAFAALSFGLQF